MTFYLVTGLVAIASALVPLVNMELYLGVLAAQDHPMVILALVAAIGQMIGKLIWFYAGQKSTSIPWVRKKMAEPKWQASYDKWRARTTGRPVFSGGICFLSSAGGIPPFAVIAVLAGHLRMNVWVFWVTGLAGRWIRFYAVLVGVSFAIDL